MSTLAPAPPPAPARPPIAPPPRHSSPRPPTRRASSDEHPRRELPPRLVAFFALATFCAAHYSVLVDNASGTRVVGLVAAATAGGALLALTARLPGPRLVRTAARVAIALATLAAGLVITGLAARLLLPGHWDELGDGLNRGFSGLDTFTWPYSGTDPWVRLVLLLGMPLLIVPAAILAFWPARPRLGGLLRWLGLALLLVAYGTGTAELGLGAWALRGAALLVVIAAWLWLPRLRPRDTVPAALAVLGCGVLALPLAASFDRDKPLLDFRSWNWFEPTKAGTSFQWDHSYGPISWSRSGITLLQVKSPQPHYWKAETLDRFDGIRWLHSESPFLRGDAAADIPQPIKPGWAEHISFTVRRFSTKLVIGAGTTFRVDAGKVTSDQPDGTIRLLDTPLGEGDTYSVDAYVPDPTAAEMRAAPHVFPQRVLDYVAYDLPRATDSGLRERPPTPAQRAQVSTSRTIVGYGDPSRVLASPYARVYRLAHRLAANQPTTYDTVKAVEGYLQKGFQYSEKPPVRRYPLSSFLFDDKIGYCQQFSGAMALMLRMDGIPARVAAGFAPGNYDYQAKEYRVRDLDAHSWVEVWFTGIGWVPFDPTPSLAPASSQSDFQALASAARGTSADHGSTGVKKRLDPSSSAGAGSAGGSDSPSMLWLLALAVVLVVPLALVILLLMGIFRRRPQFHGAAQGAVDELHSALGRLGYDYPARTTLNELERRLRITAGADAARYVRLLRQQRYAGPGSARAPTAHDRRALRRALTKGAGPLARLRGLLALPPHARAPR